MAHVNNLGEMICEEYRKTSEYKITDHPSFMLSVYVPKNPHPKHTRLVNYVLDTVPRGGRILDACVGPGIPSRVLDRLGYDVIVIDSAQICGEWQGKFDHTNIKCVDLRIEDAPIPVEDGSVDLVYFGATLEHLHNSPRPIFLEFLRILKPGGCLFVDVPNFVCLRHRILMLGGINVLPSIEYVYHCDFHAEHHREYVLEEVEKVFEWSGFCVEKAYYDDVAFQRSLVKLGKLGHQRGAGDDFYKLATIWDYNLPFRFSNWFDWVKLLVRPLLKVFPKLRDDIVVIGSKRGHSVTNHRTCG